MTSQPCLTNRLASSNIRIIWIILYKSIVWHCYISIYIYINLYKDRYVWHYLFIQWKWSKQSKEKLSFFSVRFVHINICRHTYISSYRFLYIYWYITMSNYASIKNNWYKSYVTTAITPLVACVLWRHNSASHLLRVFSQKWEGWLCGPSRYGAHS